MNIKSCETGSLHDVISSGNDVMTLLNRKTVWIRLKKLTVNKIQLSLLSLFLFTTLSVYQEFLHLSRTQTTTKEDFWIFCFPFSLQMVSLFFLCQVEIEQKKSLNEDLKGEDTANVNECATQWRKISLQVPRGVVKLTDLEERTCKVLVFFFLKVWSATFKIMLWRVLFFLVMIRTLRRSSSVVRLERTHGLLLEQFKSSWGIDRMTRITVKPAFSASSPSRFCTDVWSGHHHSQTRKRPLSHLQSCPPTLSIFFLCLLVWSLADSLPAELPNKTQGVSSEKWYKISSLKWSTEWKPWAPFWRINKLCVLNIVNGQADELQTGQLIM